MDHGAWGRGGGGSTGWRDPLHELGRGTWAGPGHLPPPVCRSHVEVLSGLPAGGGGVPGVEWWAQGMGRCFWVVTDVPVCCCGCQEGAQGLCSTLAVVGGRTGMR